MVTSREMLNFPPSLRIQGGICQWTEAMVFYVSLAMAITQEQRYKQL
jgi:hypothetical protein